MSLATDTHSLQTHAPLPWQIANWRRLLEQHRAQKMAHAYLVCGEQGIGKFQMVFTLANYLLCLNPGELQACGHCVNCKLGASGNHPDVLVVQAEAGSRDIKIDQIRALAEFVSKTSHSGLMKLIIINRAHNLNSSAANSLLKTLEEPSANTHLFLVTERADNLPATLRSRCQRLLMKTPSLEESARWLESQGLEASHATRLTIASGMRPLHALEIAEADDMMGAEDFLESLAAVRQRRMTLQSAVNVAIKMGDASAVEYLLRTSSIVIRSLLTNAADADKLMIDLVNTFVGKNNAETTVKHLLLFNLETEKALRQLQSGTNPNAQLLLESLLWQWSQLGKMSYTQTTAAGIA